MKRCSLGSTGTLTDVSIEIGRRETSHGTQTDTGPCTTDETGPESGRAGVTKKQWIAAAGRTAREPGGQAVPSPAGPLNDRGHEGYVLNTGLFVLRL